MMRKGKVEIEKLFRELDKKIESLNLQRERDGAAKLSRSEVKILGQMSLLANERVAVLLTLAQTADMDALLIMDAALKEELKTLLKKYGLVYDEDSHLVWIPKGARFDKLFDLKNLTVKILDPESVLVSKAVKAPNKNKQLVREAIASGEFPDLMDKIEKNGGDLEFFAND